MVPPISVSLAHNSPLRRLVKKGHIYFPMQQSSSFMNLYMLPAKFNSLTQLIFVV